MKWRIVTLFLLVLMGSAGAQLTRTFNITVTIGSLSSIIPAANDASANWAKAGLAVIGGIPNRTTQCGATVTPSGLIPPVANDDASKIQAAINACPAGQIVQLGSGVFQFDTSEQIQLNKGITLRGTGNCTQASLGNNPTSTGGPFCATVLQMYNGPWVSSASNGYDGISFRPPCGSTTGTLPSGTAPSSLVACPFANALILIEPAALNGFNAGWASCQVESSNPTTSNCGTTIAADVAKGATTVQVASQANFSVGQWVLIDENPQLVSTTVSIVGSGAHPASPELLNTSSSPAVARMWNPDNGGPYGLQPNRFNEEIHLISALGAGPCPGVNCTITFDSPLTIGFRQSGSHDARVYWPTIAGSTTPISFLQQAGLENLTISRTAGLPFQMYYCAYCWVKNVEAAYWDGGASAAYSARVLFTGSFFHDCVDCTNSGAEYPFAIDKATTEALVENSITLFGGKGMVGRAATAAVIAYNYVDWQRYSHTAIGDWFQDMSVNGTHFGGSHHFLLEGNWGTNCDGDNTHGSSYYHTFFRNQCAGPRSRFVDATNCNQIVDDTIPQNWNGCGTAINTNVQRVAGPMATTYWYAYVGNVLGLSGFTTTANGWVYFRCANSACGNAAQSQNTIWGSGWTGSEFDFNGNPDKNLDGTNGAPFLFKNSNFDYVTNGIPAAENPPTGFSGSLPNSMFLNSKPSYFTGITCTYSWPWVTSQTTPFVLTNSCGGSSLPAQARFKAGTPFAQP